MGEATGPRDAAQARERADLGRALRRAIEALPEPYARPLDLHLGSRLPAEAIAALLALDPETVRVRIARARGMLRRALEGDLRERGWL